MNHSDGWTQIFTLAGVHVRLERRGGEALRVVAPYGAVALLLLPMAVGTDIPVLRQVGPGFYWLVVLLFGALLTLRHSPEDDAPQRDLLAQCGVDPAARVLGRVLADAALLLAFQVVLIPVVIGLYDPDVSGWPWMLPVLPLVATGLASLGALAAGVSSALARATTGPLLVVPLALPLLLGATQVLEGARLGRAPWPWLLIMVTADLVLLLAALLSARTLEEAA